VPYKTRLTGRLMLLRERVFERSGLPVRVKKTRLAKNEGFGVSAPDPSPVSASNWPCTLKTTRPEAPAMSASVKVCGLKSDIAPGAESAENGHCSPNNEAAIRAASVIQVTTTRWLSTDPISFPDCSKSLTQHALEAKLVH
jgi:hypothetical protein